MADVDELARPKDSQKIVQRNAAMSAYEQEDADAPQGASVTLNSVKLPQEAMPVTKTSSQGGSREGRKPWSFKRSGSERMEVSATSPSSPSSPSSLASAASPASPSTTEQGRGAFRRRLPWQRKADQSDKDPADAEGKSATTGASSPLKQDLADAEASPTAAREASAFKEPADATATATATSPLKQDPADAEASPPTVREASAYEEPADATATATATSPLKQDPADAEASPPTVREASAYEEPADTTATATTSPLKSSGASKPSSPNADQRPGGSHREQRSVHTGEDAKEALRQVSEAAEEADEPSEPGEADRSEAEVGSPGSQEGHSQGLQGLQGLPLPSLPLQLERSGAGEDGLDGGRSRSPSWRKLRIREKQQRIRRRPGSTSPFESLSSRRRRSPESPQSAASMASVASAASAASPSGGRWTGVPAKASYPNLSSLRVQKPRLKDLREARRAQEAAERASSRTLPGSVLSPTKQGPIWHRLHQLHKELNDKRTELVERSLKQAEDRERSLRSEHKPRQAAPAEVQLIASKLHSQHQERQEKRQAALQENEKLLARIYSFAPSLSPKTRELVESQGRSERFSVLYDDHRRRMALREEITKKKDLEERRQISENRFHKVERKVALDAIEKLHTDAQLRAQRINEQREQKLQQELKELRAMSVHRQSKDGDAAGFGDRLFEESKQRQERKQTRALQAHNEAKAAAQPGVGAPGAPTSPRGVLHLYEDAARREESLVERRRKLWEAESQELQAQSVRGQIAARSPRLGREVSVSSHRSDASSRRARSQELQPSQGRPRFAQRRPGEHRSHSEPRRRGRADDVRRPWREATLVRPAGANRERSTSRSSHTLPMPRSPRGREAKLESNARTVRTSREASRGRGVAEGVGDTSTRKPLSVNARGDSQVRSTSAKPSIPQKRTASHPVRTSAARQKEPGQLTRPRSAVSGVQGDERLGVLRKLWQIYAETVLPLEQKSFYEHFCAPPISLEEFEARPQVLLLGQYSTGKTSMVKWLTESESNYFDVRPQPSTDKFMAVVHGDEEGIIHGNAAACLPQLPYQGLSKFGTDFLGSFQALVLPSEILRDITFIDTPGVLSGSKQRIGRDYDFAKISAWMADRADLVLLTFDAHKLDISDEFQQVMEVLRPHAGKVRCVLNKADQIDASNLVRVYGALLWNVGKVFQTPEVARVFVSSFWNEPYRFQDHVTLFEEDKAAVVKELQSLPHTALLRKINNLTARVRRVRTHVIVVGYLRSRIPLHLRALGADGPIRHFLCSNLESLLSEAQRVHGLSTGDMPKLEVLRGKLQDFEQGLLHLPVPATGDVRRLDAVLEKEVPQLLSGVGGVSLSKESLKAPLPSPGCSSLASFLGFGNRKRKREDA